jgi:succinoglycan biosynthesis protein ExoM
MKSSTVARRGRRSSPRHRAAHKRQVRIMAPQRTDAMAPNGGAAARASSAGASLVSRGRLGGDLPERISVAVCIATFRRPRGLTRLLDSLCSLEFPAGNAPAWRIVVVENDASMPNRDRIEAARAAFRVPLIHGVEPVRGIASARNRAVLLAGDVDFIAFIDDDEMVDCRWLDELLQAQRRYDADVVNGPVLARFDEPPPTWILRGRFFDRAHHPTGSQIQYANTGNVLVKAHWLQSVERPFAEALNLSGGSDTLFFSQIRQRGAQMVWCDEAIVEECIPPSRAKAGWILTRAFRLGIGISTVERMLRSSVIALLIRASKGVVHIVLGLLLVVPSAAAGGLGGILRSLLNVSRGAGEIVGLFGGRYWEYKNIHGD